MKTDRNILKWLNGDLSEQELEKLKQNPEFREFEKLAHYSSYLEPPVVNPHQSLQELTNRRKSSKKAKVRTLWIKTYIRAAAVIVLLIASSYIIFFNSLKSYDTAPGEMATLTLPDKSTVVLNASSSLSYDKKKWENERILNLDGEAFFKVSKGNKFMVLTEAGRVTVLGTQFNVKDRQGYFEVACYEGLVRVSASNREVTLQGGETFRLFNGRIQDVGNFNTSAPSWLNNESSFNMVPLGEVIAELERQYNVSISAPEVDLNQLFSGSFTHNDLALALESVTIPINLDYNVDGKNILLFPYEGQ